MLDVRSSIRKIEYQPAMFSHRLILSRDEEELDQGAWNNLFGQTSPTTEIEDLKWTQNAVTARLIAAAPELLEACRGLLAIADRYTGVGLREIAMARAAIKAAGGDE